MAGRELHGWRRGVRWVQAIMLGVLGLTTLALVAAFAVFQTGWGRERLRGQIQARMNRAVTGHVSIGSVAGNPLADLVLRDVVVHGPDGKPAISIAKLTVGIPLTPLLFRRVRIEKLIADEVDLRLTRDRDGALQVGKLLRSTPGPDSKSASRWGIELPAIEIRRGHVALDTGEAFVDVDQLEIAAAAQLLSGRLDAVVAISGRWRQRQARLTVGATLHGDSEVIAVRSAAATLGDVTVSVIGASIPMDVTTGAFALSGLAVVDAPATSVRQLFGLALPDDVTLAVTAVPDGRFTQLALTTAIGPARARAFCRADIQAGRATGTLVASNLNLSRLTFGKVDGGGGALASFEIDVPRHSELPNARAMITAWGEVGDAPRTEAVIAIDSHANRAHVVVGASNAGSRATFDAVVGKRGDSLVLERGDLVAVADHPSRATGGKTRLRGTLEAKLRAFGTLAPALDLSVSGTIDGRRLRIADLAAEYTRLQIDAAHVPSRPMGTVRAELAAFRIGEREIGSLTADALVTLGDTVDIELQRHILHVLGGSTWSGSTGRLLIDARQVAGAATWP